MNIVYYFIKNIILNSASNKNAFFKYFKAKIFAICVFFANYWSDNKEEK
jgi:hypothetical protein